MRQINVWTDGSCHNNGDRIGGWGFAMYEAGTRNKPVTKFGGEDKSTNNRMEMMAPIEALKIIPDIPAKVMIFSDSKYVVDGYHKWLPGWKAKGWRNAAGEPVKNLELWERLVRLIEERKNLQVEFCWVKGHAGIAMNELADELAAKGVEEIRSRKRLHG